MEITRDKISADKVLTKEELEKISGLKFLDYEVEMFNKLMKAKKEGSKIFVSFGRRGVQHKVLDVFELYTASNNIIYDEFIGGENDK